MPHTLESFSAECRTVLKADSGPAGRSKVCELLKPVLLDKAFVDAHFPANAPERKILYEDPELGFCIVAHHYQGPKSSPPHDHGPSWAIYGQARGETQMSEFDRVEAATATTTGKARKSKTYLMTPGSAYLYDIGALHAPTRTDSTDLVRIEGTNMDHVKRFKFEEV
jgi:hypothetical protein